MEKLKVGDKVRIRRNEKLWWPAGVPRDEVGVIESICGSDGDAEIKFPSISFLFSAMLFDLELVESAAPDPRDAEIAALKARVAELESRQSDEDRLYYRQLVAAALGGLSENADVTHWRPNQLSELSIEAASYTFAAVKRREGGDDSASERPLQENCKKNFLVRGKNLLGG